jgi:hypothetical protein
MMRISNFEFRILMVGSPTVSSYRPTPSARKLPRWGHNVPPHGEFHQSVIGNQKSALLASEGGAL